MSQEKLKKVKEPAEAELCGCDDDTRERLEATAKRCFDRVVEAHKARLTVEIFLALTTVTLTGYAFQNKRPEIFFVSAIIPLFCLFIDLMLKYAFITPFLYKAFVADYRVAGEDSEILLFLQFPSGQASPYVAALLLPSEIERQRKFRALYVRRTIVLRVFVFCAASLTEVLLGVLWK